MHLRLRKCERLPHTCGFAGAEHLLQFCGCGIECKFAVPSSGNWYLHISWANMKNPGGTLLLALRATVRPKTFGKFHCALISLNSI